MAFQINDPQAANISPTLGGKKTDIGLISYVVTLVKKSRDSRDNRYKSKWNSYERTYRGIFKQKDKTRDGERSRLIAPALTQAIDSTAATIEDAIFSRDQWIEVLDDLDDTQKQDMEKVRKNLVEDFDITNVPDAIAKIILNGCIYGTGIGKINVIKKRVPKVQQQTPTGPIVTMEDRPLVTLEAIPPWEFIIDSQARDIDSALFVAHETHVPKNVVWTKQVKGIYRKEANTDGFNPSTLPFPAGEASTDQTNVHGEHDGAVWVTEYYGLVPVRLLRPFITVTQDRIQGNGMVECIVTIANETELLRVMVNPFKMQDRPIVAYQHSYVPGKFWGAGVAEKGWNAQRALDAELRARMDALGLLTAPMMGADITRLPRNPDMRVRPGKVWLTRGRPSEVIEPIILGNIDPSTFNQSSEMERLVQVGTGAIESNAPLNTDRRNETASGISMIQSSALKRQKRVMWNIERQFLNKFIRKATWRLMQFNPQRYPSDYEFVVKGTMGVIAREFEQSSLIGLLSVISPEHPSHGVILKGVIELSSTPKREELLAAIDKANQPNPEREARQKEMEELQLEAQRQAVEEQVLENKKTEAEIELIKAETEHEKELTRLEDDKVEIQAANATIGRLKVGAQKESNQIQREKNKIDAKKPKGGK